MPRKSIKTITEEEAQAQGLQKTGKYYKICACCHKPFYSDGRRAKFCSKECGDKYRKRTKTARKEYVEKADIERLRVRFHSLAVDMLKYLVSKGKRKWKCEVCGAEGENVKIECHHRNFMWWDNRPENLLICCHKCHNKEHSRTQKELDDKGILIEETMSVQSAFLYSKSNKGKL